MAARRTYAVVEVTSNGLKVLAAEVEARRAEEACDQVVEGLPVSERTGRFAAFLASSYREFEYDTEPAVVTRKRRVGADIRDPEPAPAEAAEVFDETQAELVPDPDLVPDPEPDPGLIPPSPIDAEPVEPVPDSRAFS